MLRLCGLVLGQAVVFHAVAHVLHESLALPTHGRPRTRTQSCFAHSETFFCALLDVLKAPKWSYLMDHLGQADHLLQLLPSAGVEPLAAVLLDVAQLLVELSDFLALALAELRPSRFWQEHRDLRVLSAYV